MTQQPKNDEMEKRLEAWKEQIAKSHEELKGKFIKKELTFTATELRQLLKAYTVETLAKQLIEDKLNNDVLPRVGVVPSNEIRISYDLGVGRFVVWAPKENVSKKMDKVIN